MLDRTLWSMIDCGYCLFNLILYYTIPLLAGVVERLVNIFRGEPNSSTIAFIPDMSYFISFLVMNIMMLLK